MIAPVAPMPHVMPPPPPPPPLPQTGGMVTHGTISLATNGGNRPYVLLQGNNSVMNGSMGDLAEARRLQRNAEELLWFRKGKAGYVVRDPAVLANFRSAFDEVTRLGDAQAEVGGRQSELGEQQSKLGLRQGEIAMKLAELSASNANGEKLAALDAQQRGIAEQMEFLSERQQSLGREQSALGQKQAMTSARAEQQARKLMEEAIARGLAKPAQY